jgi:hypothetical protein
MTAVAELLKQLLFAHAIERLLPPCTLRAPGGKPLL